MMWKKALLYFLDCSEIKLKNMFFKSWHFHAWFLGSTRILLLTELWPLVFSFLKCFFRSFQWCRNNYWSFKPLWEDCYLGCKVCIYSWMPCPLPPWSSCLVEGPNHRGWCFPSDFLGFICNLWKREEGVKGYSNIIVIIWNQVVTRVHLKVLSGVWGLTLR